MLIDRSKFKAGDRVSWFEQPKREKFRRTGTLLGASWSTRTGSEWLVEMDPDGTKKVIKPQHSPVPLKTWSDVRKGDRLRLETGEVVTAKEDQLVLQGDGTAHAELVGRDNLEVEPSDEVDWINP